MKRIGRRTFSVLLIILLVVFGTGTYITRFFTEGSDWALSFYRANSGSSGVIHDRNGVTLADFSPAGNSYAQDEAVRKACFHIIGDYEGRTGAGLLSIVTDEYKAYDLVKGTTEAHDYDFELTLDSSLNVSAYKAMGAYSGCVLVSNYKTGELLCIMSGPTIDPLESVEDPAPGTYMNKCLTGRYVPGSSFKLVTSAAAIETVPDIYEKQFWCENEKDVAGVTITCMGPHYTTDFYSALANSCNCAFADIALAVGQNNLKKYVADYGFTVSHELNGIKTAAGSFETAYMGDPELAWAGIGQWTDMVCPFSMLRFVQAVANDGSLIEPYIIADSKPETTQLVKESTAGVLKEMMANNVATHYGPENFPGLRLCAKTGTAEVGDGTNNAWFVGFLDDAEHPYAFVVVVEDGGYGMESAGGIANMVLQDAVNK